MLSIITSAQPTWETLTDRLIFIDSAGQKAKTIVIEKPEGQIELEIWGSIDMSVDWANVADKHWCPVAIGSDKISNIDQPRVVIDDRILGRLSKFRFIKLETINGPTPTIHFQSTY